MASKIVNIYEFKAHIDDYLDGDEHDLAPITIEKDGKAIAELTPMARKPMRSIEDIIGIYKDKIKITGDIIGPTGEEWNAEK